MKPIMAFMHQEEVMIEWESMSQSRSSLSLLFLCLMPQHLMSLPRSNAQDVGFKNIKYLPSFCFVFKFSLKHARNKHKSLPNAVNEKTRSIFRCHCDAIVNSGESENHAQYSSTLFSYSFRRVSLCYCVLGAYSPTSHTC